MLLTHRLAKVKLESLPDADAPGAPLVSVGVISHCTRSSTDFKFSLAATLHLLWLSAGYVLPFGMSHVILCLLVRITCACW